MLRELLRRGAFSASSAVAHSQVPSLTTLDLSFNELKSTDGIQVCRGLRQLRLYHNKLSALPGVDRCVDGRLVCLSHTSGFPASLHRLRSLEHVMVHFNELRDISAFGQCRSLKTLRVDGNKLGGLPHLPALGKLASLNASNTALDSTRGLGCLKGLRTLRLNRNAIQDLGEVVGLLHLEELHLSGNPLHSLTGLQGLRALTTLHLDDCGLSHDAFSVVPTMDSLHELSVSGNSISALAPLRAAFPSLRTLHACDNSLEVLQGPESHTLRMLASWDHLSELSLAGNPILSQRPLDPPPSSPAHAESAAIVPGLQAWDAAIAAWVPSLWVLDGLVVRQSDLGTPDGDQSPATPDWAAEQHSMLQAGLPTLPSSRLTATAQVLMQSMASARGSSQGMRDGVAAAAADAAASAEALGILKGTGSDAPGSSRMSAAAAAAAKAAQLMGTADADRMQETWQAEAHRVNSRVAQEVGSLRRSLASAGAEPAPPPLTSAQDIDDLFEQIRLRHMPAFLRDESGESSGGEEEDSRLSPTAAPESTEDTLTPRGSHFTGGHMHSDGGVSESKVGMPSGPVPNLPLPEAAPAAAVPEQAAATSLLHIGEGSSKVDETVSTFMDAVFADAAATLSSGQAPERPSTARAAEAGQRAASPLVQPAEGRASPLRQPGAEKPAGNKYLKYLNSGRGRSAGGRRPATAGEAGRAVRTEADPTRPSTAQQAPRERVPASSHAPSQRGDAWVGEGDSAPQGTPSSARRRRGVLAAALQYARGHSQVPGSTEQVSTPAAQPASNPSLSARGRGRVPAGLQGSRPVQVVSTPSSRTQRRNGASAQARHRDTARQAANRPELFQWAEGGSGTSGSAGGLPTGGRRERPLSGRGRRSTPQAAQTGPGRFAQSLQPQAAPRGGLSRFSLPRSRSKA